MWKDVTQARATTENSYKRLRTWRELYSRWLDVFKRLASIGNRITSVQKRRTRMGHQKATRCFFVAFFFNTWKPEEVMGCWIGGKKKFYDNTHIYNRPGGQEIPILLSFLFLILLSLSILVFLLFLRRWVSRHAFVKWPESSSLPFSFRLLNNPFM